MRNLGSSLSYPISINHGASVVTIDDDWSGHILIEQIYDGLRRARKTRDTGHEPLTPPTSGSQGENSMVEAAMFLGFQQVDGTEIYQATASQIAALMTAARDQGRLEALQDKKQQG